MKKFVILCIVAVLACGTSYGWDRRAHATIAKIAENHLSPKAKKMLDKYLKGESIVKYASYADDFKEQMLFDLGFEPANVSRKIPYPHTFEANDDCTVYKSLRRGDNYVKNCVLIADQYIKDLKAEHKAMNDSLRFHKIVMLVHWIGDMHNPEHIRYPEDQTTGKYMITYGKKPVRFHTLWDGVLFAQLYPWGYSDCAALIDTYSKREVAKVVEGNIFDWAKESAVLARPIHKMPEGAVVNAGEYRNQYGPIAEQQVRRAGYRLAKVMNEIFK